MAKLNFSDIVKTTKIFVNKHSSEILIGLGTAGMVTTTFLAVKATPKALQLIEQAKKEEHKDKLTPIETIKATWKCYIPAAATGVSSIACIIGGTSKNLKRNAALATAYKLSETAFTEYREKVTETLGEKKEKAVREKVDKARIEKNPVSKNEVIMTDRGNALCYDPISGRHFKTDIDRIKRAENYLNKKMLSDPFGYISLNEFYEEIGLQTTTTGDDLGWNLSKGLIDMDFSSQIADNGEPELVLDYRVAPNYNYFKVN